LKYNAKYLTERLNKYYSIVRDCWVMKRDKYLRRKRWLFN